MILAVVIISLVFRSVSTSVSKQQYAFSDDNTNWKRMWKQLTNSGMSRTDSPNLTVFDAILRINAKTRGSANARTGEANVFLFEGDIDMKEKDVKSLIGGQRTSRRKRAIIRRTSKNLWERNVAYVISQRLNGVKRIIYSAVKEWQETLFPCLGTWKDVTRNAIKPEDYMHFVQEEGCHSKVGRAGGAQKISIGRGCESHGIVVHEIGHAMGFWHEESRPDRDRYVKILWDNIIPEMKFNFEKYDTSEVDSLGEPYDYESVMHYGESTFAKARGLRTILRKDGFQKPMGQRNGLSLGDKRQVRLLYGCTMELTADSCADKQTKTNCKLWKTSGYCLSWNKYTNYMRINCCKTCGCKDRNSSCSTWKIYCNFSTFKNYMSKNCKQTCGFC